MGGELGFFFCFSGICVSFWTVWGVMSPWPSAFAFVARYILCWRLFSVGVVLFICSLLCLCLCCVCFLLMVYKHIIVNFIYRHFLVYKKS
jgi:hypothetical protein